ncbi:MAG TPA: apolipoprotein N-acyltransferase [Woeseiaceae bacterium]|nr:apolipoprotein N-acyltransferase [Woeseiaceae bacterium]
MNPEHASWLPAARRQIQAFGQGHSKKLHLAYFVSGALLMLSFAPSSQFWLAPLLVLPLLISALYSAPRSAAWHGFYFGSGLFLTGTYWFYVSIHVFGQAPLWIAMLLLVGLVLIMGLYYAAMAWLICRLAGARLASFVAVAPAVWVLVEWLRGWFLSGFPWMTLGYSQIDSPLAGIAPVAGVYGVSAALLLSAAALLAAILSAPRRRSVYAALALAPWLAGFALQQIQWTQAAGSLIRTTIVQGGVSQDQKWLPEQFPKTLQLYRNATLGGQDHELIVWPEVALPAAIDQVEDYLAEIEFELALNRQSLVLGILERDFATQEIYNSVLMLNGHDRRTYRKRHLVPFGEYFPVPDFVRNWMRLMSLPNRDMTPGEPVQALLETASGEKLAVAICYEDAYGAEQLYALPDASLLINVSNDAWFGDTIAPHQHLEIARMRALEAGRYMVRATNNGVSAFVDDKGGILRSGPQFEFAAMTLDIPPMSGLTPYARAGNLPLVLVLFAVAAAFAGRLRPGRAA